MTRHLDVDSEERISLRLLALSKALEYGLPGSLESQGDQLKGISIQYAPSNCRLVIKAVVGGIHSVAFVYSDTMENCVLKTDLECRHHRLQWGPDKFHKD
jgi:hypothetical protein